MLNNDFQSNDRLHRVTCQDLGRGAAKAAPLPRGKRRSDEADLRTSQVFALWSFLPTFVGERTVLDTHQALLCFKTPFGAERKRRAKSSHEYQQCFFHRSFLSLFSRAADQTTRPDDDTSLFKPGQEREPIRNYIDAVSKIRFPRQLARHKLSHH